MTNWQNLKIIVYQVHNLFVSLKSFWHLSLMFFAALLSRF